jgi:hypothetical protein
MNVEILFDESQAMQLFGRVPRAINEAMRAATEDTVTDIYYQMSTYPTQRATATGYVRTNTLKSSWLKFVRAQGRGGWLGEVVSSGATASYNVWVQKHELQAEIHRGVWSNTDRNVIERSQRRVEGYYTRALGRAVTIISRG